MCAPHLTASFPMRTASDPVPAARARAPHRGIAVIPAGRSQTGRLIELMASLCPLCVCVRFVCQRPGSAGPYSVIHVRALSDEAAGDVDGAGCRLKSMTHGWHGAFGPRTDGLMHPADNQRVPWERRAQVAGCRQSRRQMDRRVGGGSALPAAAAD